MKIPLVGTNSYPPARQILSVLPLGFPLQLWAENDNEYDSNAVVVTADMKEYPVSKFMLLETVLENTSWNPHELCTKGPVKLGYLASSSNKKTNRGGPGNIEARMIASLAGSFLLLHVRLGTYPDGAAYVEITSS